jgi:hypothetical protein
MKLQFLTLFFLLVSGFAFSQTTKTTSKLHVYYFHATNRCPTCTDIENTTSELLYSTYQNEIKSGKILFDVLDFEKPVNAELAKKFQAYGSTLILMKPENYDSKKDLTGMAFSTINNKESYKEKLSEEIEAYLN